MLIVDMPMPVKEWNCLDCKAICANLMRGNYCGITKNTIDTLKNMRARPDWCPIKGELVRCRECYYKEEKRIMDEDALWCRKHHMYVTADWYCADGERRSDGEQ